MVDTHFSLSGRNISTDYALETVLGSLPKPVCLFCAGVLQTVTRLLLLLTMEWFPALLVEVI
jgi:hypothetical protein